MARFHWVRVGVMGHVGRYSSVDCAMYDRLTRVVARTDRGLELGEVLAVGQSDSSNKATNHGVILRQMTASDKLVEQRLQKNKLAAFADCAEKLQQHNLPVLLIEVELLFDGSNLVFYFLGPESPALDQIVEELTEAYEAQVQFRRFTEQVDQGCGTGCGTDEATNGCGNCASQGCAIAAACASHP